MSKYAQLTFDNELIPIKDEFEDRDDLFIDDFIFLSAFKKDGEISYFRCINDSSNGAESFNCEFNKEEYKNLKNTTFVKKQEQGWAVHFVVNGGGHKNENINKITSFKMDFDFLKYKIDGEIYVDKNGQTQDKIFYRTLIEVEQLKQATLKMLYCDFQLEPSIVVETKNGFHVYWLLEKYIMDCYIDKFSLIEKAMVNYFNTVLNGEYADDKVTDLARVFRIINFMHLKDPSDPFRIKAIKFKPNLQYMHQDVLTAIGINSIKELDNHNFDTKPNIITRKTPDRKSSNSSEEPYLNERADKYFSDINDLIEYLRSQDLCEYLNIGDKLGNSFKCIFHADGNPSAQIVKNKEGAYKYICRGTCSYNMKVETGKDVGVDIIDIEMIKNSCELMEALVILQKHYNVSLNTVDSEWSRNQLKKYEENIDYLNSIDESFIKKYPNLYKMLKLTRKYLMEIYNIGMANIFTKDYSYQNNNVFFFSVRYLSSCINSKESMTVSQHVNLLCALRLIEKVPFDCLHPVLLEKSQEEKERTGVKSMVNYYSVPNIVEVLDMSEYIAQKLVYNKFNIKRLSKDMLLAVLGEDAANRVYSFSTNMQKFNDRNYLVRGFLINQLEQDNYISWDKLKEEVISTPSVNNPVKTLSESQKRTNFNLFMPQILEEYNLVKVKANKELKEKYKLKNYSDIYIRSK
ncbi:hypothetical protein [Clostridium sp.]|uniref:hypothetical protein n=1 Tax=Clostridium sp. TaxID=1506 RepID=UPI001A3D0212|nr:hypothetical protein [Clostridium sp.]MBK5241932.1 hypothetical protein [Clostridium sp.]